MTTDLKSVAPLMARNATRMDFLHVIDLIKKGSLKVKPFITHRANLTNLKDEFSKWIHPETGVIKAIVNNPGSDYKTPFYPPQEG